MTVAFICSAVILSGDGRYIIAMVCTALHEAGHIAVMLGYGEERIDVKINLFNIAISDRQRGMRTYREDAAVICAGPLVNLVVAAVFFGAYSVLGFRLFYSVSIISGILCVFNLLPMESTDGGQLAAILMSRFFSESTVRCIMTVLTVVILLPVACVGFYVLLNSGYNYTLLFSSLYFAAMLLMRMSD